MRSSADAIRFGMGSTRASRVATGALAGRFLPSGWADWSGALAFNEMALVLPLILAIVPLALSAGEAPADPAAFFEQSVRPVLVEHCYACHSAETRSAGGLAVDNLDALVKGGDSGPAVVPGNVEQSLLLARVQDSDPATRMPRKRPALATNVIHALSTWIEHGAVWPASQSGPSPGGPEPAQPKPTTTPEAQLDFFEKKVRPILVNHCYACHSAETKPAGGLRVDDLNGLLTGGNTGPAIVRGAPERSLLIERIRHDDPQRKMPKESEPLSDEEIGVLETWIRDGAAWPVAAVPRALRETPGFYAALKTNHWAWQPLRSPSVPAVRDSSWPRNDVDWFVLARLEREGLRPVADADRRTLIRRVTFDLTGLPPAPTEIEAFVQDETPEAYSRVVDRLLASRAYAERWGRHWLDVARYAESTGPSRNIPYPHAWRYRDYVVDAVGRDVPFDRFVQEQIAGDLLPADSNAERDRLLTATGFLALGVKDVNQRFKVRFIMDNVDEQIDTVTRAVLGLTVSCARCHDHKFDPIPTADYYALAGIFTSTEDKVGLRNQMGGSGLAYYVPKNLVTLASAADRPRPPQEQLAKLETDLAAAKKAWEEIRGTPEGLRLTNGVPVQRPFRLRYEKLQAELNALTDPAELGYAVHGAGESSAIANTAVRIRGEAEQLGPVVPRGFLSTFAVPDAPAIPEDQSGRLQLAQWLTSRHNPLTSRVIVNRVWQHLFGQGLVSTVDNFGVNGEPPSHPELLDHLALRFIEDGWSLKRLVRTLVLTRTYQLGSTATSPHLAQDPANRLYWRHTPRRLAAEEVRDAILASAGTLQSTPPRGSPASKLKMIEIRDNGPEARGLYEAADRALYRSVYLPLVRGITPKALAAFDPVEQNLVTGRREETTVPTQALFLLNSSFVRNQSLALAVKLLHDDVPTDGDRVRQAFLVTLGRFPVESEVAAATAFLDDYRVAYRRSRTGNVWASLNPSSPTPATTVAGAPEDPDNIDRSDVAVREEIVPVQTPEAAAWAAFAQALFGSAEFRYLR